METDYLFWLRWAKRKWPEQPGVHYGLTNNPGRLPAFTFLPARVRVTDRPKPAVSRESFRLPCCHPPVAARWWPCREECDQSPVWPARCDYCEPPLIYDLAKFPSRGKFKIFGNIPEGHPWRQFGYGVKYTKRKKLLKELREHVDPQEVARFQIVGPRNPKRRKDAPAWIFDEEKLSRFRRKFGVPPVDRPDLNGKRMQFNALCLYHRVGVTVPEIAETSGKSEATVEGWIRRLTKRGNNLVKQLEEKAAGFLTTIGEAAKTVG